MILHKLNYLIDSFIYRLCRITISYPKVLICCWPECYLQWGGGPELRFSLMVLPRCLGKIMCYPPWENQAIIRWQFFMSYGDHCHLQPLNWCYSIFEVSRPSCYVHCRRSLYIYLWSVWKFDHIPSSWIKICRSKKKICMYWVISTYAHTYMSYSKHVCAYVRTNRRSAETIWPQAKLSLATER